MDPITNESVRSQPTDTAALESPVAGGNPPGASEAQEQETRLEIEEHIATVQAYIARFISMLVIRAQDHDRSKLEEPEFSAFAEVPRRQAGIPYGSPAYLERLKLLKPALDHHYSVSRHHPEHFADGIRGMNLIDVVEMFSDWLGSWTDYGSGDFESSIEHNRDRFDFGSDLESIFKNTAEALLGPGHPALHEPAPEGDLQ